MQNIALHTDNYTDIMHVIVADNREKNEPKSEGFFPFQSNGEHMTFILLLKTEHK